MLAALLLSLTAGEALAQAGSATCRRLEAQLQQGGDTRLIRQQQAEIGKLQGHMASLGCNGFFKPSQCWDLESRSRQMQANLSRLSGAGRSEILAALNAYGCRAGQPVEAQRTAPEQGGGGFFSALFGRSPTPEESVPQLETPQIMEENRPRFSGARLVCVKTCDGSFYPLNSLSGMRDPDDLTELCALQCPGAEVQLYRMGSDGEIENAVNFDGVGYMRLSRALAYRRGFDKTCTCRPEASTWYEALKDYDDPTIRSGDILVSPEQARIMSLPAKERAAEQERLRLEASARREAARAERRRQKDLAPSPLGADAATPPDTALAPPNRTPPVIDNGAPPSSGGPIRIIQPLMAPKG